MKKMKLFLITESGMFASRTEMKSISEFIESRDIEIMDFGMGSAYLDPIYLLGEIESIPDEAIVVVTKHNADESRLKFMWGRESIDGLIMMLERNLKENTWEIANRYYDSLKNEK